MTFAVAVAALSDKLANTNFAPARAFSVAIALPAPVFRLTYYLPTASLEPNSRNLAVIALQKDQSESQGDTVDKFDRIYELHNIAARTAHAH